MKKVLQPKQHEEAVYYSDFSGKLFTDFAPVTVKIECGYGSKYDESDLELHLSDSGLEKLLEFLKENLCENTKKSFKKLTNSNCQSSECCYNKELYEKLI